MKIIKNIMNLIKRRKVKLTIMSYKKTNLMMWMKKEINKDKDLKINWLFLTKF